MMARVCHLANSKSDGKKLSVIIVYQDFMDFIISIVLLVISLNTGQEGRYFAIYIRLLIATAIYSFTMMLVSSCIE